jgi:SNF2 family DNA or RNA helicase
MNNDVPAIEIEDPSQGPVWITSSWRHKDQCKQVPGARWDAERKMWRCPLSWASCKQLRGIFGDELQVGDNLRTWASMELERRVAPALALRMATAIVQPSGGVPGSDVLGWEYDDRLYGFQQAGVAFLLAAINGLLTDEMGTGKTVQLLVLLRELERRARVFDTPSPYPCLVIAPNSVKTVWRKEAAIWNPDASVALVQGTAKQRQEALESGADITIINYEQTWRHSRLAPYGNVALSEKEKLPGILNEVPWSTIIADEAHRLKSPRAKQTRATWAIGHGPTVQRRWGLTGTPLANALDEFWSLLHFVDPAEWPAKTQFVDRYCVQSWNPFGGMDISGINPVTQDELYEIVDPRMRRMPKALVLPFLPPKRRSTRYTEMTTKQAKAYKEMKLTQVAELQDAIASSDNPAWTAASLPIVQRLRLMQFSSSFAYVQDAETEDAKVRLDFPSNKIDEFMDFIDELPRDEPVVVFAESRQLIEMLGTKLEEMHKKGHGGPVRYIVGGMTADQRELATTDFMEGRAQYILCTIKAGGEGITLTRAKQCVFLQRSDSLIGNKQAEDRVHRIGSEVHDSIHIVDFVAPDTVEVDQIENLLVKLERLEEIVRDKATLQHAAAEGNQDAIARLRELEQEEGSILATDSISTDLRHHEEAVPA